MTPRPGSSSTSPGNDSASPRLRASATTASASTCGDSWSAEAAIRSTSAAGRPGAAATSVTAGCPAVRVPVLSSTIVWARPRFSNAPPLRTTTPRREARDSPETIATGAASSNGHGVATTSTATARSADPLAHHASPARASDRGRNQAANRSASRITGALSAPAWRTSAMIPA